MKRPENWKELSRPALLKLARELLVWNCDQEVSNKEHNRHYIAEIEPIYRELEERWARFVSGGEKSWKA